MNIYKGVMDGIDLEAIGLKMVIDDTIRNIRETIENDMTNSIGKEARAVIHLSLLDRNERYYCLGYNHNSEFGLLPDGKKYLEKGYRLRNKNRGLMWAILEKPYLLG